MIIPLHDYVLIRPDKAPEKLGGIIIARHQQETESGVVVATGPQAEQLAKGDRIMYKDFNVLTVKHNNKELFFVHLDDVICIDEK